IRELAAISALRARRRFRQGDTEGAMNDALAAIAAARHLSLDGTLASVLFGYKLEADAGAVLAEGLPQIPSSQLTALASRFDSLPVGSTLGKALEQEKLRRNDLREIARKSASGDELVERLVTGVPALRTDRAKAAALVAGCGGTVAGF